MVRVRLGRSCCACLMAAVGAGRQLQYFPCGNRSATCLHGRIGSRPWPASARHLRIQRCYLSGAWSAICPRAWPAPTVDRSKAGLSRRDTFSRTYAANAVLEAPADVQTPKEISHLFSKLQNGSDVRGIAIAGAALKRLCSPC